MEGSEKEKMLSGELYRASDPELVRDRLRCRSLLRSFNAEPEEEPRLAVLRDLLGRIGDRTSVQPPFACDYGYNVQIGDHVFINFNAVILDCAPVTIGDEPWTRERRIGGERRPAAAARSLLRR